MTNLFVYRYKENAFVKINAIASVKASMRFIDGFFEKKIGAVIVDNISPYMLQYTRNRNCWFSSQITIINCSIVFYSKAGPYVHRNSFEQEQDFGPLIPARIEQISKQEQDFD